MLANTDAVWLAGLLEGEGWFILKERANRRPSLEVGVQMRDLDVVQRAHALFDSAHRKISVQAGRKQNHNVTYTSRCSGIHAERIMLAVLPYMGARRSAKIRECLATPNLSHYPREKVAA